MSAYRTNQHGARVRAHEQELFKSPDGNRNYRQRPYIFTDTPKALTKFNWQRQIDLGRQIFARMPVVHGAVCQKALYAVGCGWRFHYIGENEAWGKEAEEYLNEIWYPSCDIRGEPYDFWLGLYLDSIATDRDGDEAMIMRRATDLGDYEGPVRVQWVAAHRIGDGPASRKNWDLNECTIESGPFKGAKIKNGVIKNRDDTTIGVRVIEDGDKFLDLPANACQLLFEPDWNDLVRGIPRTAYSCLDQLDIEDINHFLKRQVKLDASQGITIHNEKGGPMNPTRVISSEEIPDDEQTDAATQDIIVEQLAGNEREYFKANTGGKIEALKTDRPSPNTEKFVERIETQSLFSIGWARQLMDPQMLGGANVRSIQDNARKSIEWRQGRLLLKRAIRASVIALADAQTRGVISINDTERWWNKLGWTMPAQLTVDAGYDEKADLEHLRFGTSTAGIVTGKKGHDYLRKVLPTLGKESQARIKLAKKIADEEKVPLELVLNDLRMANQQGLAVDLDPDAEKKASEPDQKKK